MGGAPDGLHERLAPLAFLLGEWSGPGRGLWSGPGEPFAFSDRLCFAHDGRAILAYRQQTTGPGGEPSHGEAGYLTADLEWTIASPIGVSEVLVGHEIPGGVEFTSVAIALAPSTDRVTSVRRRLRAVDGGLLVEVAIAVQGEPVAPHTESRLVRVRPN